MGSIGGGASKSSSKETRLSKKQAEILGTRENQYQEFFFPELVNELNEANQGAQASDVQQAVGNVNQNFKIANSAFEQRMAQRNLANSGVAAAGAAQMETAQAQAKADTLNTGIQVNRDKKLKLLQMGGAMSPTPTTAAPMGHKSSSWNASVSAGK